ncbi:MAG: PCMD domain-containing protein [Prevotellaceae bacterium]|jgi:hypothetical protein|nr:PCMD domain-containing protein [Prevotellaceae bacterium]
MKKQFYILLLMLGVLFASCIKNELPNSEADIVNCEIPDMPAKVLDGISIENKKVKIWINADEREGIKTLTLNFSLSDGATILPENGTIQNFENTDTVSYTVTSENGKWQKKYIVEITSFALLPDEDGNKLFSFDHFEITKNGNASFHQFYEWNEEAKSKQFVWSSGNGGFGIVNSAEPPENYPTSSIPDGKAGNGVKLTTSSTGSFGEQVKMPIAAGNLFLGTFDILKAMKETLKATNFGMRSKLGEPELLRFWYKYQRGAVYKDKDGNVMSKTDNPDIYAVLYEPVIKPDGTVERLDGTNIKTADNIIAIADLNPADITYSDNIETAEYSQLSIPFVKRKEINTEKLRNGVYFITIVFSSSADGSKFEGAVGSTLCIDEVQLICK